MRPFIPLLFATAVLSAQTVSKSVTPISVGRKVALVIGNSAYSRLDPIPAAANDADDMAAALRRVGFVVGLEKNLGVEALITEIGAFAHSVRPGDLALIYYSGHGGSVGEENYLLPVDYDPPSQKDLVDRRAYAMSKVRDVMEQSGAQVRVLIFDACRGSAVSAKGAEGDPHPIEGKPEGTLIAFASAHKQDAMFDASRRNSLYTGRLLTALNRPDSDLKGLLETVQRQVYQDTAHTQTPYLYGFLSGPLFLAGAPVLRDDPAPKVDAASETWSLIRNSQNPADFDDFAKAFPGNELAAGARVRAAQLRRAPATQPSVVAQGGPAPRSGEPQRLAGIFQITGQMWPVAGDLNAACRSEFGATAAVADWNDVTNAVVLNGLAVVLANLNLRHGDGAAVTFGGQTTYAGSRHYFIQRLDGNKPGDYLAHAELGGNVLVVGSWYDPKNRIVCKDVIR